MVAAPVTGIAAFIGLAPFPELIAQPQARFEVPLYVSDGPNRDTLYFGIVPGAVFGVSSGDSINGHEEYELPPVPPTGVFDSRFVWPRGGATPNPPAGFGQGTPHDYRPYISAVQRDTFRVRNQLGEGTTIVVSWPPGLGTYFTQLTLRHFDGTANVNTDMLTDTSVDITNPNGDPHLGTIYSGGLVLPVDPPPAPSLVSPADGALNVSLEPVLTWSDVTTATTYRLQVARDSLFGIIDFDDSTLTGVSRQVGPLSSNTLYYWRVRAKNTGGVSPYSSTFRFTTTEAPPAPLLVSPQDSATRVPSAATFLWSRVTGATSYHLQIAADATFTSLVRNDSTIIDTTRTVPPLPYSAMLHWRVRARNSSGPSEFSAPRVFTVMLQPPSVPTQIAPANNQTNAPVEVVVRWTHAVLAAGYHLQIAHDTLMTNIFSSDTTITDSSKVARVAPSTAYYWRVRARNTENTYGAFTPVHRFTTANVPPAIPIPTYPANGDTGVIRDVTLRYIGSPSASVYRVQVSFDIAFTQIFADDSTVTATEFAPGVLPSRISCFWRVRAKGTAGWSQYCAVQSFRTGSEIVSVEPGQEGQIPSGFALHQNYPNPFNPSTTITFEVPAPAFVTLRVYDLLGREIQTLVSQEMNAGTYAVHWDGQNEIGGYVPSGVYFVRMAAGADDGRGGFSAFRKLVLLK